MSSPLAPSQSAMSLSQWLLLMLLSLLWGCSFFFVAVAVKELPPFTLVLARVGLAAAVLVPVAVLLGHKLPRTWPQWQPFLILSLLQNVVPFSLIVTAQQHIASGLASVLNATTPLFGLVLGWIVAGRPMETTKLAGVLTGVLGVAVLIGWEGLFGRSSNLLGTGLCLAASFCYGLSGLHGHKFKDSPPLLTAACQLLVSTLLLLPVALLIDRPWTLPPLSLPVVAAVAGLAMVSTILAYLLFFRIMAVSGPMNVLLVTLLIPVSAILLGALALGELLSANQLAGALVIGMGLLVIDGRPWAYAQRTWRGAPANMA